MWEEVIALVGVPERASTSSTHAIPNAPPSIAAAPASDAFALPASTTAELIPTNSNSSSNEPSGGKGNSGTPELVTHTVPNDPATADADTAVPASHTPTSVVYKENSGAIGGSSLSSSPQPPFGGTPRAAALLLRYRQRLLELNNNIATDAAESNMVLDTTTLGRYLLMANGHISPLVGLNNTEEDEAEANESKDQKSSSSSSSSTGEEISTVKSQMRRGAPRKPSSSVLRSPPSPLLSHSRKAEATAPSQALAASSNGNMRCAATLLAETVRWRKEQRIGQLSKAVLLQAARARQLHVAGYDREGRAVVIYTPTTEVL